MDQVLLKPGQAALLPAALLTIPTRKHELPTWLCHNVIVSLEFTRVVEIACTHFYDTQ